VTAITSNTSTSDDPNHAERRITDLQRSLTRLYALLHDIAHVPFGHTLEDELKLYERHDENPARLYRFLGPTSDIGKLIVNNLGQSAYDRFMAVYIWDDDPKVSQARSLDPHWKKFSPWLEMKNDDVFIHDIVSNTVCADLLDYLQRDNYFCNLGIALEYRFLNFLYLHVPEKSTNGYRRVFVRLWKGHKNKPRRDTLTDLARLLEARYMVAERAYFHHTKLITGAMLGRALQEASSANELTEEALYDHSDDSLLRLLRHSKARVAAELGQRLGNRRLHKVISVFDDAAFQQAEHGDHDFTFRNGALEVLAEPEQRRMFEDDLADKVNSSAGSILIYAPPPQMNLKLAKMNVRWKGVDTHLCAIDDPVIRPRLDEIISAHKMLWGIWLIGDASLSSNQQSLAIEEFKLRFLIRNPDQHERRMKHVEELIKLRVPYDATIQLKRLREEVEDYLATSTDKRTSGVRLKAAAEKIMVRQDK